MSSVPRAEVMTDERLDSLERSRDSLERWREEMERRFAEAFPGGDHVGHCRYHALMIEGIEWRKRLYRAVMEKAVAGLVWGTLLAIGYACWQYFLSIVRKGL